MSQARIYTTKGPVRKDGLTCGKCGTAIVKGQDRRRTFAVGFRGYERTRCMKTECTPTRGELESSAVGAVYDAIDSVDLSQIETVEGFTEVRDDIVSSIMEVADEYEQNEMFEINYDLQERVDTLQSAAMELENWEPEEEPEEDDFDEGDSDFETFEEQHADWVEEIRESLQAAIDDLELP